MNIEADYFLPEYFLQNESLDVGSNVVLLATSSDSLVYFF